MTQYTQNLVTLVYVYDSLRCMTDYKNNNNPGQQSYHRVILSEIIWK